MGNNSGRSKRAKKAALAEPKPKYPVDFAKPCGACQKGTDKATYIHSLAVIMEGVIEKLESYRGKGDYCYELGDGPNPEHPLLGNLESGLRFLNGKTEVWDMEVTISRDWSLDKQIAYVRRYMASKEDEAKIAELDGDWQRIQCVLHQLYAIIPRVKAGEFDAVKVGGATIKNFVSPSAAEGGAWIEALESRIAKHKGELEMIKAEVSALNDKNEKYYDENEVVAMKAEVRHMRASKSACIKERDASKRTPVKEDPAIKNAASKEYDNSSKGASPQNDNASKGLAVKKDDPDKSPAVQKGGASKSATSKKDGASKSAPKRGNSSKVVETMKDVAAKGGATIAFYAQAVKVEQRMVKEETTMANKAKGKKREDKDPEKIMVISVVNYPVYTSAAPRSEDTSSCGGTSGEGLPTEKDTGGEGIPTTNGADDKRIPTDMGTDDEGILADMDTGDEVILTGIDTDDEGTLTEMGTDDEADSSVRDTNEVTQVVVNSPKLCRIFAYTFCSLVITMVGVLPFAFIFWALKVLVIKTLQALGVSERQI